MQTRLFLLICLWPILAACTYEPSSSKATAPPPNILFIFADDQTYTSIQALGNPDIHTPNLDQLVDQGASFSNAYNMGSWTGAVCAASRAMLVSGRSVWRANDFRQNWREGDSLEQTWPKMMEQAGYDTYLSGKWHVDAPAKKVFQQVQHVRPGMPKDKWNHKEMVKAFSKLTEEGGNWEDMASLMPIGYNRPLGPDDHSWSPTDSSLGGFWEGGTHWSEVLAEDAISFLQQSAGSENPFFMYLAFNAAHDPRQAPQTFQDLYDLDSISTPASWLPMYPYQFDIGNGPRVRDEALAPFPRTEYAIKVHTKEYYALISHMDAQIGKILDELEASGQAENTYIFFTADHGLAMGRHGLLGKQNLFEHSMKVPFMVTGPHIPAGKKVDAPIYLQDVMASSLELAGIEKPDYVDFHSVMDLAKGKTDAPSYGEIYGGYINYQRMIRKGDMKLMVYPKAEKLLLFDLKHDPEEMRDLSDEPAYELQLKALFQELLATQQQLGDTLDLRDYFPDM